MTAEQWAAVVDKNPEYAEIARRDLAGEYGETGYGPCKHLGGRVPAFEFRWVCNKGVGGKQPLGFSTIPGVKPCQDCGPDKCPHYLPKTDIDAD